MKDQQEKHDILQKEAVDPDKQKQYLANYLQIAISVINALNQRILYLKDFWTAILISIIIKLI